VWSKFSVHSLIDVSHDTINCILRIASLAVILDKHQLWLIDPRDKIVL